MKSLHEYLALPSSISYRVGFVTGPPISFLNFLTVYTALFPDVLYVLYIRGVQTVSYTHLPASDRIPAISLAAYLPYSEQRLDPTIATDLTSFRGSLPL